LDPEPITLNPKPYTDNLNVVSYLITLRILNPKFKPEISRFLDLDA